jgi:hypothetical protein
MFVQVIEGKVADVERLRQQLERWDRDLRPGAAGFLGTTGGVTDDARGVLLARFDSASEARANSDRPEQGQWWADTASCFDGEVTFTESEDVEMFLAGGSDDAGFVQVMKSNGVDRDKVRDMDRQFEEVAAQWRPDLIGSTRIWTGPDRCIDVAYFTSEAAAREGEQKEPPPELAGQSAEFEAMMSNTEFLDLRQPWLF